MEGWKEGRAERKIIEKYKKETYARFNQHISTNPS